MTAGRLCVVVTVYGDTPPSTCILRFWFNWDVSGGRGGGGISPSKRQSAGKVENTVEHRDWTPSSLENVIDADIARRKGNIAQ